jgi:hypothetical protein
MTGKLIRKLISILLVTASVASLVFTFNNEPNKSKKNANYAFPLTKVNK